MWSMKSWRGCKPLWSNRRPEGAARRSRRCPRQRKTGRPWAPASSQTLVPVALAEAMSATAEAWPRDGRRGYAVVFSCLRSGTNGRPTPHGRPGWTVSIWRLVPARCFVIGELDVEAGVARLVSIAIAVVGAQPGAFHEPQPEVQGSHHESDLVHIALLRLDAATQPPDDVADLSTHSGWPQATARFWYLSIPCFLTVRRAPLDNPLRLQGLASLASAPTAI